MRFSSAMGEPRHETIDELLAGAREGLERLEPAQAQAAAADGAILVDIRSDSQRGADGLIPEAIHIPRNVLEWRCDPASDQRDERLARRGRTIVLISNQGYQSSLAAATLRRFGAWRAAELPVDDRC
jgi:rhodanese-related sulfurtransferase